MVYHADSADKQAIIHGLRLARAIHKFGSKEYDEYTILIRKVKECDIVFHYRTV